ncbi:carbon storage regulator CsrA [Robertmurraya massiliosenegalensis]|uniref:carbon storage regulator CsrA n=1 Tax=Robertmurraya TaxID=2837507 RepID=UPI0039A7431D
MLVLTRKLNQAIQIGDDIEIKILSVDGEQIKVGINAPKNVEIHRKEVYLAIQEENNQALDTTMDILTKFSYQLKNK